MKTSHATEITNIDCDFRVNEEIIGRSDCTDQIAIVFSTWSYVYVFATRMTYAIAAVAILMNVISEILRELDTFRKVCIMV